MFSKMKLQNFLKESTNAIDLEYIEKFEKPVQDIIQEFTLAMSKAGLSKLDYLEDASEDTLSVVFVGKFLEAWLVMSRAEKMSESNFAPPYSVEIQVSIPDDMSVDNGRLVTEISSVTNVRLTDEKALASYLNEQKQSIIKLNEDLTEWYFDMSSHYGKVKMYVETRGPNRQIRALAGEFDVKTHKGEVFK